MSRLLRFLLAAPLAAALATPALAAWSPSPYVNTPLSTANADQYNPVGVTDGAGGAIYAWQDYRNGNSDIYAQRLDATGTSRWTANGVAVCTAAGDQGHSPVLPVAILEDGVGGAYVAWEDSRNSGANAHDVYLQHLNASGAPLWTANGIAVAATVADEITPALASDGAGGVIVVWALANGTGIYGRRFNSAGTSLWAAQGIRLADGTDGFAQFASVSQPLVIADGSGGIVLGFAMSTGITPLYPGTSTLRFDGNGARTWRRDVFTAPHAVDLITLDALVSDGAGGAIASYTWQDGVNFLALPTIRVGRVLSGGGLTWELMPSPPSGQTTYSQRHSVEVADGTGGVIVAWEDGHSVIYAQHVAGGGQLLLGPSGKGLATTLNVSTYPRATTDGAGGAIVAWEDHRALTADVYAQHLSGGGSLLLGSDGLAICSMSGDQYQPFPVSDGAGGVIFAWDDSRSTFGYDLYASRLDRWGYLGDMSPAMAGVRDVRNDQGGHVKVSWLASAADTPDAGFAVGAYWIWRSVPASAAQAALAHGARMLRAGDAAPGSGERVFQTSVTNAQTIFWEYVGSQPASGDAGYSFVAPTAQDSVPGSNPLTYFRVQAHATYGTVFWNSNPDSGYSVDNLGPATPAPFAGQYAAGTSKLHWNRNSEADLAGYKLYRGTSPAFAADPAHLVATLPDTGYTDPAGAAYVYKLTAVDIHGNESPVATWLPTTLLDVAPAANAPLALAIASAQPAHGDAVLRFTLPSAGAADLAVFDASGRRVRVLASGSLGAGAHGARWDGADDAGRSLPGGLYFVRLAAAGEVRTARLVRLR